MGEYFKVVNETKREYFDPSRFGESEKLHAIGTEMQGRLLGLLLVDTEINSIDLKGSWSGDKIVIAGDTGGTLVNGNLLYFKLKEQGYIDITIRALAILCGDGFVNRLVSLAETDEKLKKDLFFVVDTYDKIKSVQLGGLKILLKRKFNIQ